MNVPEHAYVTVPENAHDDCLFAARELIRYISEIFGVRCELRRETPACTDGFFVGETAFAVARYGERIAELTDDAFIVCSDAASVVLTGKDSVYSRAGTVYAVYDMLEKLGCGFYSFDEEFIPDLKACPDREITFDYTETPAFEVRQILAASTRRHPDYVAKMRIKDCYCGAVAGGNLSPLWANGSGGAVRQGHNFYDLIPPKKYKQAHPEWFDETSGQLCFSQPDLIDEIAAEVVNRVRKNPQSKFFAVSQNDTVNPCGCEKCKAAYEKYGVSGTLIRFINAIARKVKAAVEAEFPHREIYIVTFAYYFSIKAPVDKIDGKFVPLDPSVVPDDNVYIFYTTIDHCFYHPLTDKNCEWNAWFEDNFAAWKQLSGGRMMVWNYSANYAHYLYPFFGYRAMRENYAFFARNGIKYVLDHGNCEGEFADFAELKTYVLSKICWNPERDVEALMREFITAYYREAAPEIEEYFDKMNRRFEEIDRDRGYHLRLYNLPESMFAPENFPLGFIRDLFAIFDRATEKANGDETLTVRLIRARLSVKFLLLMNYDRYGIDGKKEFEEEFAADCKRAGITKYKEQFGSGDHISELIALSEKNEVLKY